MPLRAQWHGQFAAELGLIGAVRGEAFERLVNGQNPVNGEQWIKHRATHLTASGKEMPHRAAWDLTFNAPKEVSLTALVGGDLRVREAHRAAVKAALDAGEMYTQARGGGSVRRSPRASGLSRSLNTTQLAPSGRMKARTPHFTRRLTFIHTPS